jgi:2,4-dienoyl-CoA reductase-like NADH-dependent reductase (Old Yellow Enzyme family)
MARNDGRESPDVFAGYARPNASNRTVVGSREELDPTSGLLPQINVCDMTSALFSPIRLAALELANRVVVSPMCQYSADDGVASDWHINHLGMLANSGAALVVAEATGIERRGRITHGCLGLYSDDCEAALARVVAHCRRYGTAKLGIQLAHAGRKASAASPWEGGQPLGVGSDPWETIAPSAIPFGPTWPVPREMTAADMERVRNGFVEAAKRALRAGIDAIELHGAHGYLLHSFISPVSNKRSDGYGGALAARMHYPLEIAQAVRAVVPKGVPLGARITGNDWLEGGLTPDDAVAFARALKGEGLDFVCISSGGITAETRPPSVAGLNLPVAEKVKREAGIATRVVGLISTPKQAEATVADGKADMVALARGFLDNPHWAWHAAGVLGAEVARPKQYQRAAPKMWPGAAHRDQ